MWVSPGLGLARWPLSAMAMPKVWPVNISIATKKRTVRLVCSRFFRKFRIPVAFHAQILNNKVWVSSLFFCLPWEIQARSQRHVPNMFFFPDRFLRRIGANFLWGLICFLHFLFDLEQFLFPVFEESCGILIMRSCSDIPRFPQDIQQLSWFGSISPRSWFGGEMMTATWRCVFAPWVGETRRQIFEKHTQVV